MLCDQASDEIIFYYQTNHLFFYDRILMLSTARCQINPVDHSQWLRGLPPYQLNQINTRMTTANTRANTQGLGCEGMGVWGIVLYM